MSFRIALDLLIGLGILTLTFVITH